RLLGDSRLQPGFSQLEITLCRPGGKRQTGAMKIGCRRIRLSYCSCLQVIYSSPDIQLPTQAEYGLENAEAWGTESRITNLCVLVTRNQEKLRPSSRPLNPGLGHGSLYPS